MNAYLFVFLFQILIIAIHFKKQFNYCWLCAEIICATSEFNFNIYTPYFVFSVFSFGPYLCFIYFPNELNGFSLELVTSKFSKVPCVLSRHHKRSFVSVSTLFTKDSSLRLTHLVKMNTRP